MNSKTLRRLGADQAALHNQPLPPNYLFPPTADDSDNLSQLDILLAGPTHTPFSAGVWRLHLTIPTNYPQQPPTANFRTPIFHPNVDPQTGGVCVETLKRDWDVKLTLRDVLVTISCLLIQPNPDSALNAEAGGLIREDYDAFAKRAKLMTSIHATVPRALVDSVKEAQTRGQDMVEEDERMSGFEVTDEPAQPARRRHVAPRHRAAGPSKRRDGSPSASAARRRQQPETSNPFVVPVDSHDPFTSSGPPLPEEPRAAEEEDSSMLDADQENDESRSPTKLHAPLKAAPPRRPPGAPVPLGELSLDDIASDSSDTDAEPEYPPSPRKSPSKSPTKRRAAQQTMTIFEDAGARAESSRAAAARFTNTTPPDNPIARPLAGDSPFVVATDSSPRKTRVFQDAPGSKAPSFPSITPPRMLSGVNKTKSPSSLDKRNDAQLRRAKLNAKLWRLCGEDIRRWNRGDFGEAFRTKAMRW